MTTYREQCSLVLDRNELSLSPTGESYIGTFIPANPNTLRWLEHFNVFADKAETEIPVVIGILGNTDHLSHIDKMIKYTQVDLNKIGLYLIDVKQTTTENEKIAYTIEFKFSGPLAELAKQQLDQTVPFILSVKSMTNDEHRADDVYKSVTTVVGLQLLRAEDLEIAIPEETLDTCTLKSEAPVPADYPTLVVDTNKFLSGEISLGNVDLESVIKLNLAAGNGIDYQSNPDVGHIQTNLQRQIGIDASECFELLEAYVTGDVSLLRDALADKRITLNGFQPILPFSLIVDYRSAVENNFTRFDTTYERALETQEKYAKIGVETQITGVELVGSSKVSKEVFFVNKVAEDSTDIKGEHYSKGKWVKSKYFKNDKFDGDVNLFVDPHSKEAIETRYRQMSDLIAKLSDHMAAVYTSAIEKLDQ